MPRWNTNRLLIGWLLAAFALRMGYVAAVDRLGVSPPRDLREYVHAGSRLQEYGVLSSPFATDNSLAQTPSAVLPPIYAGLVAVAYAAFGVESFAATLALQLINAVATTFAVLLVFLTARMLAGSVAAWWAAIIATVNPALFAYTDLIWDTCLFALGVALAVYIAVRMARSQAQWWRWLLFGAYLGVLALLSPALTMAYPILILWPLHSAPPADPKGFRLRSYAKPIALAILGWMAALAPWTVRNHLEIGRLTYVRNGLPMELWLGACPEAGTQGHLVFEARFPLKNEREQAHLCDVGEQAYLDEIGVKAAAAISNNPARWLKLVAMRTVDYWFATMLTHRGDGRHPLPRGTARLMGMLFLGGETFLLLVLAFTRPGRFADLRWLAATTIAFSLTYCVLHVQIRYRAPVEPIMGILCGALLVKRRKPKIESHELPAAG